MSIEDTGGPNYGILTHRFVSSKQWDRALATSREWLGREPENLRAHLCAAQSLINLDREAEAEPHLQQVLAGRPNNDFAHRLMSLVHYEQDRFPEADESIRKAISLNPRDAYHWHHLSRMSYHQGDLATAKSCAEKARELRPGDPNIENLLIMCEPDSPISAERKIQRYEAALALDPEVAAIHNNIGAQYLNVMKDYAKAEECFRRALFYEPTSKLFRKNLFITLKHRDVVYRLLCAPKDGLFKINNFFYRARKQSILLYLLLIPIWLIAFRFVVVGLFLWFALVWPLTKVYEYLTVGDIRARAGEVGARRGGFLGYRKWPLILRLSLFAFCLFMFWGAIALVAMDNSLLRDPDTRNVVLGALFGVALIFWVGRWLLLKMRKGSKALAARRRAKQMKGFLELASEPKKLASNPPPPN